MKCTSISLTGPRAICPIPVPSASATGGKGPTASITSGATGAMFTAVSTMSPRNPAATSSAI